MLFWFYIWNRFDMILTRIHSICKTVLWWESEGGSTWKFPSSAFLDGPSVQPVGWTEPAAVPALSLGALLWEQHHFLGPRGAPGSHVQLLAFLGSGTEEWDPFCSAVVFFLIFFLLSWSILWVLPIGGRGISPNCDTEVIRNANRGGKGIVQ